MNSRINHSQVMKTTFTFLAFLTLLVPAYAQEITGTWYGQTTDGEH
jgi:hypothetical protein